MTSVIRLLAVALLAIGCARAQDSSATSRPSSRASPHADSWSPPKPEPDRVLSDAAMGAGIPWGIVIMNTAYLRERSSCEGRPSGEIKRPAPVWDVFIRKLTPAGTAVWIDSIGFVIRSKEWELKRIFLSSPARARLRSAPPDFDSKKLFAWLSLCHAVTIDSAPAEFIVTWRRTSGLLARFEAVTESKDAATKLHERLAEQLKASRSTAKSGVFDGGSWWRVDVEAEDFSMSQPEASESRAAHRLSVKITWEDGVLAEANEGVRTLEGLRKLIGTIGERVDNEVQKAPADRFPFVVTVAISVPASFPLQWLQAAIFDLESHAHYVEVGQDRFFETAVRTLLSIERSLSRCPVRPFKSIGLARAGEAGGIEKLVVTGLELQDNVSERDESLVILGPAGVEAPDGLDRTWLAIGHARGGESRPISALSQMSSTAGELGAALTIARQPGAGAGWRQRLRVSRISEVRGAEIVVGSWGAYARRRAQVVTQSGSVYVGTIEVADLPSIEHPDTVPCKIIERSRPAGAPAFAAGQLVIFQPD